MLTKSTIQCNHITILKGASHFRTFYYTAVHTGNARDEMLMSGIPQQPPPPPC